MDELFIAFQSIAIRIKKAISDKSSDYTHSTNSSGDVQLKLDVETDMIVAEELSKLSIVNTIASEEKDGAMLLHPHGRYYIAYDPLDGSSIINSNFSVGTIFGIYDEGFSAKNLVASAYIMYGPRTEMTFALNKSKLYVLHNYKFEFSKTLQLQKSGKLNATGGTQEYWSSEHRELVKSLFDKGYRLRYSGGMVPDLHNILIKGGGLFSYPKTEDVPNGKLRKLFEVFPFAKIFECANGYAVCKEGRILDQSLKGIHDTTDCYFGSKEEIDLVEKLHGR